MWKGKFFNQAGRTILTQTSLGSMATHTMSVFPMPKVLTDRMDSIQLKFWWSKDSNTRGVFLKSWDDVALPKDQGGLNIRKASIFNKALLTKLAWRMLDNEDAMWVQILCHKYFLGFHPISGELPTSGSWIW